MARNLEAKRQQQSPNISEISSDCSLVKRLEHELKVKNEDALQSVNLLGEQCNWVHEHIQRIYLRAIEIKSKTNAQADREVSIIFLTLIQIYINLLNFIFRHGKNGKHAWKPWKR